MIDLHAHLLPGVDDGPSSWEEALAIVQVASSEGITAMVATSHMMPDGPFANTPAQLLPLVDELRRNVREAGLPVDIYCGAEVYMTPDVGERFARGELLTYNDAGRYMLLEMPSLELPRYAGDVIFALQIAGVTAIVAHPERNFDVIRNPARVAELVELGALLQVNVASLGVGRRGRSAAQYLLKHGLVHFLATDAHDIGARAPRPGLLLAAVRSLVGDEAATRLLHDNPAAVLAGVPVEPIVPIQLRPNSPSLLQRLLRRRTF